MKYIPHAIRFRCLAALRGSLGRFGVVSALAVFATLMTMTTAWAGDRVYDSPKDVRPLSAGQQIPMATVRSVFGKTVDLATAIGEGGALLVFYRGGW